MSTTSPTMPSPRILTTLCSSTTADICDALLTLKIPYAGFLPDLFPRTTPASTPSPTVALASTILFGPKTPLPNTTPLPKLPTHPADSCTAPTPSSPLPRIAIISQPTGQRCAVLGGLVAARLQKRGIVGAVVDGRVRDVRELEKMGMPIWSKGLSCVGAGAESVAVAVGGEVEVQGVVVKDGDVVVADEEGVVVVPRERVEEVVEVMEDAGPREEEVRKAVERGEELGPAIKLYRQK